MQSFLSQRPFAVIWKAHWKPRMGGGIAMVRLCSLNLRVCNTFQLCRALLWFNETMWQGAGRARVPTFWCGVCLPGTLAPAFLLILAAIQRRFGRRRIAAVSC